MRPQYHYAPAANWLSDPNGLVHAGGEWHLFYQYNPQGEDWGHMAWGHAVSCDLDEWTELLPALVEDAQGMVFSGSAVIDRADTAGFGADSMVAIYTVATKSEPPRQTQCLAHSQDNGHSWARFAGNPVLDRAMSDFRDPNVFWHAPSEHWVMVVVLSDEHRALIYRSTDLKEWNEVSEIAGATAPGAVWECPLLIELPIEGESASRWLFKVDVLRGAPGSGALYRTGTFDGVCFVPDGAEWQVADWGADFYAAIAWHEPRDAERRPLWIGWLGNHAYQRMLPEQGWRGAMSLPRRIGLRRIGKQLHLTQQLERRSVSGIAEIAVASGPIPPASRIEIDRSGDFALVLDDCGGRQITIERQGGALNIVRRDAVTPQLDVTRAIDAIGAGPLSIWLDHGSVEIFANHGACAVTLQHRFAGAEWHAAYRAAVDAA